MAIPIYLAMTPAEFFACPELPRKAAWMACHFSPCGDGLSNLPECLPADSLLILDDSTPFQNHNCDLILLQLHNAVAALKPAALLLDFQRPEVTQVEALAKYITEEPPCPVAVSSCYAAQLDCPIFLSPGPLYMPLSDCLKPYRKREIWLDAAPVCAQMVLTTESSQYIPHTNEVIDDCLFFDAELHCHYHAKIEENQIIFTLSRTCNDLVSWLEEAETLDVSCAVGIYQELKDVL